MLVRQDIPVVRDRRTGFLAALLLTVLVGALIISAPAGAAQVPEAANVYANPLQPVMSGGAIVESCADPATVYDATEQAWYLYCTTDPLHGEDRNENGDLNFHLVPILRSLDLVNWQYAGDAFAERPSWAASTAGIWAPDIQYFNGQYYLYFGITDVVDAVSGEPNCGADNAIGVATAPTPTGPWSYHDAPVVAPRRAGPGCNFFWTFDPDVLNDDDGQSYIYYGSYYGGMQVRELSADGLSAAPETAEQVAIPNRYEGGEVFKRDGYYYLFVSATNCCNGPLTGYSVFAGRASDPRGPFVDREGVSLLAGRVGGTPVVSMNGNRWVGMGHNDVFTDFAGQTWTFYHAVDRFDPYFAGATGFTKRPVLLDPVDWIDGWPMVRGGLWASDDPQHAPAAQPGDSTQYRPPSARPDLPGRLVPQLSDEFDGAALGSQWSWVRPPDAASYGLAGGAFRFDTQAADLHVDSNNASVLLQGAPAGSYVVEARVRLNLPPEGCCFNYVQAGLVVYGDDDNYLKLVHVSIWETRQTEFAKELAPVPPGFPRYGNTVVGPPGEWTTLRIVKEVREGEERYTAYTSRDGVTWVGGGTWTHNLGDNARIGLVSLGGSGFTAEFDYVRVYKLHH